MSAQKQPMWEQLAAIITETTGETFRVRECRSVSGGSINQAYRVSDGQRRYFVKINQAQQLSMFEAEQTALKEMRQTLTIQVPQPLAVGVIEECSYLVLEWLDLVNQGSWRELGQQLAALHRVQGSAYGWQRENRIGSTPQPNPWTEDWQTFWREYRLGYQLGLAQRQGFNARLGRRLLEQLPQLLGEHHPTPSLVHGDLWGGNAAFATSGEPVVFDPALYYGDREVDLAMTELFGGFPQEFYRGYELAYPLDPGYSQRKTLYNLYHVLNHYHLFGGGYGAQAEWMILSLID
jgi:fructosamine-3-kinase